MNKIEELKQIAESIVKKRRNLGTARMIFPEELVHNYGAKAGLLIYTAQELPKIPQMEMVVKDTEEPIDDFVRRIDEAGFELPIMLRSSAAAELDGYEGDFLTYDIEGTGKLRKQKKDYLKEIKGKIKNVENSPRAFKDKPEHSHLPDKINVIAVERSLDRFSGTYIKHPNQEGHYIFSVTGESLHKNRFDFIPEQGLFQSMKDIQKGYSQLIKECVEDISKWHDQIASLPLMDNSWSYQIEFGLFPNRLFQVRPFKPIEKADFEIEQKVVYGSPLVIGITPEQGIDVRVERNLEMAVMHGQILNPDNDPSCLVDSLRIWAKHAEKLSNLQANILWGSEGILAHEDIKVMRRAQVSILYPAIDKPQSHYKLHQDHWINIKSDGKHKKITKLE